MKIEKKDLNLVYWTMYNRKFKHVRHIMENKKEQKIEILFSEIFHYFEKITNEGRRNTDRREGCIKSGVNEKIITVKLQL